MITALGSIWVEITSALLSLILSIGTMFGAFVPANTTESSNYYDEGIKNVIYLIGDGMGFNHLEKTKQEKNINLTMDTFDYKGESMTRSVTNAVTDSAAGGTALATGVRTYNGAIGVYFSDSTGLLSYPKNLTELCKEAGKLTGVVTSDETSGATPATFSAHSSDRSNTEDITMDQFKSGFNLIWGAENGVATKGEASRNGYEYISTIDEMMALPEGSYSFGQFTNDLWTLEQSDENTPTLLQMTEKAVDILDDTDQGFFLMVEGAHIDKHSHNNEDANMTEALEAFDKTVEFALEYAKADGETLVIVTADHETGGIVKNDDGTYSFTQGSHSAANVPVLVYGSENIIANGEVLNNYEIPIRIAYLLGFTEDDFPFETVA